MKKFITVLLLLLVMLAALSGCGGGKDKPDDQPTPNPQDSTEPQNPDTTEPDTPVQPGTPTQSYQDTLSDLIPFSVDIGPGWEFRDLTVNGTHRRIAITFEMDSSTIDDVPCISYYRAEVLGEDMYAELVSVGRAFLPDIIVDYLKEYRDAGDIDGANFEMFEYDFKASTYKGKDKEYIVFTVPASWEPNTSSMVITTDHGLLLADLVSDKSCQVTLEGENPDKYKDSEGNSNFFSFSEDAITYLKVSERSGGVTYLTEYSLTIDNDKITSTETGRIYQTSDTVPDTAELSIYS